MTVVRPRTVEASITCTVLAFAEAFRALLKLARELKPCQNFVTESMSSRANTLDPV